MPPFSSFDQTRRACAQATMKSHVAAFILALPGCYAAIAQSDNLTLAAPAIVILHNPPSEIANSSDGQFAKFSED
jgi:hypothetical protein